MRFSKEPSEVTVTTASLKASIRNDDSSDERNNLLIFSACIGISYYMMYGSLAS